MQMTNNLYVVAREIYNNETLTIEERPVQLAAAFNTMIEAGVATMADFEDFLKDVGVKIGYNDQAQHVTTVKHPNGRIVEVINFLNQPGSDRKELGQIRFIKGRGHTWMDLTVESIREAIDQVNGTSDLAPMEKEVLVNALKQVRNA